MTIIQPLTNPPSKDKMLPISTPSLSFSIFFFQLLQLLELHAYRPQPYRYSETVLPTKRNFSSFSLSLSFLSLHFLLYFFLPLFFFLFFFHFVVAWHQCLSRRKTSPRGIEMRGQFKIKIFQLRRDFSEERRGGGN